MDPIFLIAAAFTTVFAYTFGYHTGIGLGPAKTMKGINEYITKTWPDEKHAYMKGVNEGYEQGLRDGGDT